MWSSQCPGVDITCNRPDSVSKLLPNNWYGCIKSGGCPMIMARTHGSFLNGVRNCAVSSVTYTGAPVTSDSQLRLPTCSSCACVATIFEILGFNRPRCRDNECRIFGEPGSTATPS